MTNDNITPNENSITEDVPKDVKPVVLEELTSEPKDVSLAEMAKLQDLNLKVKVIFSNTKKTLEEMLAFKEGEVIRLNRFAGEPVDVLVNDSVFAKGEITVVDDKFGARIIEILPSKERLQQIK